MNTRDKLITTTSKLIKQKGYYGTGINEVLKSVSVPKGSLYHHFPKGKDELMVEAVLYAGEIQMQKYGSALRGKPTLEGLVAMVDVMIDDVINSEYQEGCAIASVAMVSSTIDPAIQRTCDRVFKGWQRDLAGYLERRNVENAEAKSKQLYAMFEGAYILSIAHKDANYLEIQKDYIKVILDK